MKLTFEMFIVISPSWISPPVEVRGTVNVVGPSAVAAATAEKLQVLVPSRRVTEVSLEVSTPVGSPQVTSKFPSER